MNICKQCGTTIPDGVMFCPSCGAPAAVPYGTTAPIPSSSVPTQALPQQPAPPISTQPTQALPPLPQAAPAPTQQFSPVPAVPMPATGAAPTPAAAPASMLASAPATQGVPPVPGVITPPNGPGVPSAPVQPTFPGTSGAIPPVPGGPAVPGVPGAPVPGVPGMPGVPGIAVAAKRRMSGGKIAAIVGGIVAVLVVVALAIIIPNLTAVKALLGFRPNNPFVVTSDAIASIGKLSSTRYELSGSSDDTGKFSASGSYSLGADTDSSMLYFTTKTDDYGRIAFAWQNGNFGALVQSKSYWTGDMETQYGYASRGDIRNAIRDLAGSEWDDIVLDTKDVIVKDKHWDFAGALETFNKGAKQLDDNYDVKRWNEGQMSEATQKEYAKFALKYFGEHMEKKDVQTKVFPKQESVKSGGNTKLTYDLDLDAFLQDLGQYWQKNEKSYPELRAYLVKQLREQEGYSSSEAEREFDKAVQKMADGDYDSGELPSVEVMVDYGAKRSLNELEVTVDGDSTGRATVDLKLSDKDAVSVDDHEVSDFMAKAKSEGVSF